MPYSPVHLSRSASCWHRYQCSVCKKRFRYSRRFWLHICGNNRRVRFTDSKARERFIP